MKNFNAKVAIITGAGSGLGRAMALQLYQAGAHLALCDLNLPGLEETRQLTGELSERICLHTVDVSDRPQMVQFAQDVLTWHEHAKRIF